MSDAQIARERERRLAGQPFVEGHYWLGEQFCAVSATFYPTVKWWIEDCAPPHLPTGPEPIPETRRPLTEDIWKKLRAFL